MKKKIFSAAIAAVTAVTAMTVYMPVQAAEVYTEEATIDGVTYTYEIYEDMAFLTDCEGFGGSLVLPDELGSAPLVAVGEAVFSGKTELKEITLNDSLILIDECAFMGSGLEHIEFGKSLVYIEGYAFSKTPLAGLNLPDTVEEVGKYAFEKCDKLTDLRLSAGTEFCGNGAFNECTNLVNVEIPEGFKYLGEEMFSGCTGIKQLTLPGSIEPCGYKPLPPNLESLTVEEGVTYIPDGMCRNMKSLTNLSLPDSVEVISPYAFAGCTFTEFTLPPNVQKIDRYAFEGCENLTAVQCPETLEYIGGSAFNDCWSLETIAGIENVTYIGANAFTDTAFRDSITDNPVILGDGVLYEYNTVGDNADFNPVFSGVKYVSPCAFDYASLQTVEFSDGLKAVYESVMGSSSNYSLTEVKLPNTLEYIGDRAFAYCSSLETVNIPDSVTYIGNEAFRDTPFEDTLTGEFVIVGDGLLYKYNGTGSETEIVVPSGVKHLAYDSVHSLHATSLTLPDTLETIDEHSIYMPYLTSLVIPDSVKRIEDNAVNCPALIELDLGEGVEYIGTNAFWCSSSYQDGIQVYNDLHFAVLPNSLKEIKPSFGYYQSQGQYTWYNPTYRHRDDGFAVAAEWGSVGAQYARDNKLPLLYIVENENENLLLGDIDGNGAIEIADAVILNRYLIGKGELTLEQAMRADIDCDNIVDSFDMVFMRKLLISWNDIVK